MQIKSLPIFKKIQSLLKRQNKQAENQNPQLNQPGNLNLLSKNIYTPPKVIQQKSAIITTSKIIVILLQAGFLAVLAYNYKVQKDLVEIENEITQYEQALEEKAKTEETINTILLQTTKYKEIEATRDTYADKINLIYNQLLPQVELVDLVINNPKNIQMEILSQDALTISLLISKYLESGEIEQIIIRTARLSTRRNEFSAELQIDFK